MTVTALRGLPDPRDINRERRITTEAAGALHADPEQVGEFIIYAETRAGTAPVRDHPTRDFKTEAFEELADLRNYLTWWIIQAEDHGDNLTAVILKRVLTKTIDVALELELVPATRSVDA